MPPIAPSSHLTSCIQVWAAEFIRSKAFITVVDPKHSVLALMSVIGDRFARYLPPNFCVQLKEFSVMHKELRLFLAPAMRNSLTMCHVFKMRLGFSVVDGDDDGSENDEEDVADCAADKEHDSEDELKLLFSDLGSKLSYITKLDVKVDHDYCELIFESTTLRGAMFASLPRSLQSVSLHCNSHNVRVVIDANDIRALAALPHLHELRVFDTLRITSDGIVELFRRDKPAGQLFFPNLRCIEAVAGNHENVEFLRIAADSIILPQLWEFVMRGKDSSSRANVNAASFSASLRCLSHIRVLGDVFSYLNFSGPLDLSSLRELRKVGDNFFSYCDFHGHTLDLSVLTNLEELGSGFLYFARKIGKLILPPNLRRAGQCFCTHSSVTALDFSAVAHSLESIDLESFWSSSKLVEFDSSPFAGKIVGNADFFLFCCSTLVDVNLSGFRGVKELGDLFLCGCPSLRTVRGMDGLAAVKRVGRGFMSSTRSLAECDFSKMVSLRTVPEDRFLAGSAVQESGTQILRAIMAANNEKDEELRTSRQRSREQGQRHRLRSEYEDDEVEDEETEEDSDETEEDSDETEEEDETEEKDEETEEE